MVILGGLELVVAGVIVHKIHKRKVEERKQLEEQQLQPPPPQHRPHSHSPRRRKTHHSTRPSQPPPVPPNQPYPVPYNPTPGPASGYNYNYNYNNYPLPPGYPPQTDPNRQYPADNKQQYAYQPQQPTYQNTYPYSQPTDQRGQVFSASTPSLAGISHQDTCEQRGRSPTRPDPGIAELSGSGPRNYNTHLSPTPHVRFAVANDGTPQPGEEDMAYGDPPPRYQA